MARGALSCLSWPRMGLAARFAVACCALLAIAPASASAAAPVVGVPQHPTPGQCNNLFTGTFLDDRIVGSPFGDVVLAGRGDDRVVGLSGNDCLQGEGGDDILSGGPGADDLRGQPGDDTVTGGAGDDSLVSGPGDDVLSGGSGDDTLSGGDGYDSFNGGPGNDTINSRDTVGETVRCGNGRDTVTADRADRLFGCERVTRR